MVWCTKAPQKLQKLVPFIRYWCRVFFLSQDLSQTASIPLQWPFSWSQNWSSFCHQSQSGINALNEKKDDQEAPALCQQNTWIQIISHIVALLLDKTCLCCMTLWIYWSQHITRSQVMEIWVEMPWRSVPYMVCWYRRRITVCGKMTGQLPSKCKALSFPD